MKAGILRQCAEICRRLPHRRVHLMSPGKQFPGDRRAQEARGACDKIIHCFILGTIMFASISSSGRKGTRSSSGGLTMVPSGIRFPEDFGSKFWSVSTNISQITGPSVARADSMAPASSELCSART